MNETQTSKGDGVYIRTRGNVGATSVMAVITALLFLSLASPAVAADQVPFKGRLEGSVAVTVTVPPFASVFAEGTGNATHLGRFTWEFPHMVNQAIRVGEGTYTLTAANGDTVTIDVTGTATLIAPGVLSTTETGTITGGTGRFADATGTFTTQRTFFVALGVTTGSFEGTISSPGNG